MSRNLWLRFKSRLGERAINYSAVEAPTVRTETSGVASVENGTAEVSLPDHFGWVTDEDEDLVVQLTPHAVGATPAVTERSPDRLVIQDDGSGPERYEVSYTVKGTRSGYRDRSVVTPARADESA